jgi:cytochrome P450
MTETIAERKTGLRTASLRDTLAVVAQIALPTLSKGVIIRRPKVVGAAQQLDLDQRAVRRMQRLRAKYGAGPLLLPIPGRRQAVVLDPEHVHRVLDGTPEPFATASTEKRAALAHLEPNVSLISHGPERAVRRRLNEDALDTPRPVHRLADRFLGVVNDEAERLIEQARARGELVWDDFFESWYRVVRRVVLGDGARDDHELTSMLAELRSHANWAFLRPRNKALLERFHARLEAHLARAEPGSLAAIIAAIPNAGDAEPSDQVAHWLFAFDPAGMTTFRALALLATHPDEAARARVEVGEAGPGERQNLHYLRACILESLRLWPTTPLVLRETTADTEWDGGKMPSNTHVIIFAPFFHRDDEQLPFAHRFSPELWLEGDAAGRWPLIPFSDGPAKCPAHNFVPMLTSAMLAALIDGREVELRSGATLGPDRPLPATLDNYALRFALRPMEPRT